ncbi:poly(ADP-ribose) glycohydrolase [Schistocerca nitens]|uniref:poly(ADP-ribose) glycohydrolase n=1 Tax=Schistocerca nitens TaxID=7011 RepID=UPI002118FFD1|nr:poly(ADP-ribose) glycohydrolase [Schistocerca nitens]XP_049814519.1 poly(ADP-ribose) glycohydrolase [Schistocerca nitens]
MSFHRESLSNNQTPVKRKRGYSEDDEMSEDNLTSSLCGSGRRSSSPDMFADSMEYLSTSLSEDDARTEKQYKPSADKKDKKLDESLKQDTKGESCPWRGVSLEDIKSGYGLWGYPQLPPVRSSNSHAVLYQLPVGRGEKPAPLKQHYIDKWDSEYVRMPFSPQNLCAVNKNDGSSKNSPRRVWELVEEALLRNIVSSQQLEAAILSYCSGYGRIWDFTTLHYFLSDVLDETEVDCFFSQLLPNMVQLALQLPSLIRSPVPLLKQFRNSSVSLSQLQIASLLSNAFFCTFPRRNMLQRNSEYATFPDINFNRLFQANKKKASQRAVEKLKCILHYFRRVCHKAPEGVVTFTRRCIAPENLPLWETSSKLLNKLHITSCGTIEDEGRGMLQVDFANKRLGGGVLRWGCVQEEIRFVICPELIVSRLFTESMEPLEAVHIIGCERFSNYKGYGDNFEWSGDHCDTTPRDSSGRRLCSITAIDALAFRNPNMQYTPSNITRELNKAYVGFFSPEIPEDQRTPVATGNWGCGVYRGNAKLKSLLQLMAATEAGRHLAYFTFGNETLRDDVFQMYTFLMENRVTVGKLWQYLQQYYDYCVRDGKVTLDLYAYLYKRISDSETSVHPAGNIRSVEPGSFASKNNSTWNNKVEEWSTSTGSSRSKLQKSLERRDGNRESSVSSSVKDIGQNSAKVASESSAMHHKKNSDTVTEENLKAVMMEVESVDNEVSVPDKLCDSSAAKPGSSSSKTSLLDQLDKFENTELPKSTNTPKRKISDYFNAVQK